MNRLDEKDIGLALGELEGWRREGDALVKDFRFKRFADGIGFVDRLAVAADQANHHPDIDIRYTTVRVALSTHDAGGITPLDVDLAKQAEALAATGPLQRMR